MRVLNENAHRKASKMALRSLSVTCSDRSACSAACATCCRVEQQHAFIKQYSR